MNLIADILMVAGALGAGFYCLILSRRLSRFTDLEKGVGGAIAVLSAQVDDMTKTLMQAQKTAAGSGARLEELTRRAEESSRKLELLVASMHDLPEPAPKPKPKPKPAAKKADEDEAEEADSKVEALFLSQRSRVEAAE